MSMTPFTFTFYCYLSLSLTQSKEACVDMYKISHVDRPVLVREKQQTSKFAISFRAELLLGLLRPIA